MSKTLILMFHPDPEKSVANALLARAAAEIDGVEVVDIAATYPGGRIDLMTDGAVEAQRLLAADRIVFQFPVQWYSVPSLMKDWIDAVFTRIYYVFAEREGDRLEGTPLMIAATAGNTPENYAPGGRIAISLEDIFTPLRATAVRAGMPWHRPHILYHANALDAAQSAAAGPDYQAALRAFIAATPKSTEIAAAA
ncbi:NAD(P)H-dependent oxidoreductase [Sphingopyxis sp. H115]|uniref:NAD(P)H-dependent oxidoreductase n=1 Tax=Sphingopyxis sp. H115 TaxID=1759073 RepID=UPI0007375F7F|nr:NAD(P)H-dependent oxidoreductase [Sphingopyxis sp. H115]KTE07926.1 NAD(P)H dehydrogenase [Sphingopyxis sp. H115]